MADWNLPLLTSSYTQFLTDLKDRDTDSLTMLDGAAPANLPAKAKRWNDANKRFETWNGTAWTPMVVGLSGGGTGATSAAGARSAIGAAAASHTHTIANVTNLQATLDGKAPASHTHTIANVTNLQATLDGKASASHTHTVANVTGLQATLDGKANTASLSGKADLTGASFTGIVTATASQGWEAGGHAFEVRAEGSGAGAGPALVAFHRGGAYAIKLGLDTDNQMKIGGWSAGANRWLIWHSGNFNPGSYVSWGNHVAKHEIGQIILVVGNSFSPDSTVNGNGWRICSSSGYYSSLYNSGVHIGGTWISRGRFDVDPGVGQTMFQRIA